MLQVCVEPLGDVGTLRHEWVDLCARAQGSFFLSWHWIGSWLQVRLAGADVLKVTARAEGRIVGLALLHQATVRRHGFLNSRMLALHEYLPPGPNFMVEHNGVLAQAGWEEPVERAVVTHLARGLASWNELQLSGISDASAVLKSDLLAPLGLDCLRTGESASWQVDLERARAAVGGYLAGLTRKTRYKLRQYLAVYQARGEVEVDQAQTLEEAFAFFDALKALHQAYWAKRGQAGSFSNPIWEKFHRGLIESAFHEEGVQLLRVRAGNDVIGYLYNLVHCGHVSMIQSGYDYGRGENTHPGFVCVYAAIEHNVRVGHRVFDLLAGSGQYKRMLSNTSESLVWVRLRRPSLKFRIEDGARQVRRKLRGQSDDVSF